MRTAPQSIGKPGRNRPSGFVLCIGPVVLLYDWEYLREWASRCYAIRDYARLHTILGCRVYTCIPLGPTVTACYGDPAGDILPGENADPVTVTRAWARPSARLPQANDLRHIAQRRSGSVQTVPGVSVAANAGVKLHSFNALKRVVPVAGLGKTSLNILGKHAGNGFSLGSTVCAESVSRFPGQLTAYNRIVFLIVRFQLFFPFFRPSSKRFLCCHGKITFQS